ncbi:MULTISPECIES: nucleoside 2-deoxyribosyltransferase [Variovorax]|jgi:nucleoside 2-deoxyribosyltransferase|uniref:nucleoside 2-deoxyribosyltransferase n=1 Tax=Variovorax sp. 3P27G3 TaxID=2502214 RepID=UPI0010F579A4|nr:nucleoside 2-deoxyribosyltransferase [Variovorax sp. 3P27G3]
MSTVNAALIAGPRIYLAGPDVFHPNARAIFARLKAHCERLGLRALVPIDAEHDPVDPLASREAAAQRIYESNIALLRQADGVAANLQPFRGLEPDSGTVFEVGFAAAMGLPVVAYGVPKATYGARVCAALGCARDASGAARDGASGMVVEEFDQRLNLMLARSMVIVESAEAALQLLANSCLARRASISAGDAAQPTAKDT